VRRRILEAPVGLDFHDPGDALTHHEQRVEQPGRDHQGIVV
jgi:hypothetical protein